MIHCKVSVGIGMWKVRSTVELVACPHVGDMIVVNEYVINCERVYIHADHVSVDQSVRFTSEADLDAYIKNGWHR